jgi:GxxExxY protein
MVSGGSGNVAHHRRMDHHRGTEYAEGAPLACTYEIVGAAIQVHRQLGPGLLESAYQACLCRELAIRRLEFESQVSLPVKYRGMQLDCGYRLDSVVLGAVIIELKAVSTCSLFIGHRSHVLETDWLRGRFTAQFSC